MFELIDKLLNRITMYRLVLYYLIFLLAAALGLGALKLLPYSPEALLVSTAALLIFGWSANKTFAHILKIQTNVESVYITALILALIITPPKATALFSTLPFLFWASAWAQAGKYILNIKNKHIFNPAAFAVALTALTINQSASWWIGTPVMLAPVLLGGCLMVKKVQRWDAVLGFLVTALLAIVTLTIGKGDPLTSLNRALLYSPLFFFAAIMLTEPLTMPPTIDGRIAYGILTGWLFAPQVHLGSLYFTPELALLVGNVFSYVISPKGRYALKLKKIVKAGTGVYDFIFQNNRPFRFKPGQYMEWTLGHDHTDSRGNRRYFTLASSPTETSIILGVKFYANSSSYKRKMLSLKPGDEIIAAQLAGDFVLPRDLRQKLVFVAGGIGITPFRSMLKYLVDKNSKRPIKVLYSNRTADEIAYQDVLCEAEEKLGIKTVYTLTDKNNISPDWEGYVGHFNAQTIAREIPDYDERTFYISGSHTMVTAFKKILADLGIPSRQIVTDFFPGLA